MIKIQHKTCKPLPAKLLNDDDFQPPLHTQHKWSPNCNSQGKYEWSLHEILSMWYCCPTVNWLIDIQNQE